MLPVRAAMNAADMINAYHRDFDHGEPSFPYAGSV
jgi:hypothetical protein